MKIWDDDAPVFEVSAGEELMEEDGARVIFNLTAKASPNDYVTLHYDLTESGDYFSNEGFGKSVRLDLSNGGKTVLLPFSINNNAFAENDGTITFTLKPDTADSLSYTGSPLSQ